MNANELERELDCCCGTEYYLQPSSVSFRLTEGADLFLRRTGAWGMLRQIQFLLDNELTQDQRDDWFKLIKITEDYKLVIEDGNGKVLATADLDDHAEIPQHEWRFFFADSVLMVPSEY